MFQVRQQHHHAICARILISVLEMIKLKSSLPIHIFIKKRTQLFQVQCSFSVSYYGNRCHSWIIPFWFFHIASSAYGSTSCLYLAIFKLFSVPFEETEASKTEQGRLAGMSSLVFSDRSLSCPHPTFLTMCSFQYLFAFFFLRSCCVYECCNIPPFFSFIYILSLYYLMHYLGPTEHDLTFSLNSQFT